MTDARNALLLLAVTHVRYDMSHGKNKENKAYSRLLFFNLQPNGIPGIIEHVLNETLVLTRQDFLPLKVKEHHLQLLFTQVSESIGTPLEGNSRDYGDYKHYSLW